MTSLIDIRRKARRDLHEHARVPAVYLAYAAAEAVGIRPRVHDAVDMSGLGQNVLQGLGERFESEPGIVFDLEEIANPESQAYVILGPEEGYRTTVSEPARDGFQKFRAVRMDAADVADLWDDAWESLL